MTTLIILTIFLLKMAIAVLVAAAVIFTWKKFRKKDVNFIHELPKAIKAGIIVIIGMFIISFFVAFGFSIPLGTITLKGTLHAKNLFGCESAGIVSKALIFKTVRVYGWEADSSGDDMRARLEQLDGQNIIIKGKIKFRKSGRTNECRSIGFFMAHIDSLGRNNE